MGYVDEVLAKVKEKNASEPEFLQAVEEVLESLRPVIDANEELYRKNAILENHRARPSDHVPCTLGRRQRTGSGKQRISCTVQQCHWTIQGWFKTSPICKLRNYQILRF